MAGNLPPGREGSLLSFLQGGTPEQKQARTIAAQNDDISSRMAGIFGGFDPKLGFSLPPLTNEGRVMPTAQRQAFPVTQFGADGSTSVRNIGAGPSPGSLPQTDMRGSLTDVMGQLMKVPSVAQDIAVSRLKSRFAPPKIGYAPAGSQPIDERTGAPIGSQIPNKENELPAEIQAALFSAGGDPAKAQALINQWKNRPGTSVTIGGDKAVTGVDAKRYEATIGGLTTLDNMAPFLERMKAAQQEGAQTGFGQDWVLKGKQALEELFDTKLSGTSEQEVFKSAQNYLGPRMRTVGSGASSDRDVTLFLDSLPSLTKTEMGNNMLYDMYGKIREYQTKVAEIQQKLLRQHDYIPVTEERRQIAALGPIFSDDYKAQVKVARDAAPKSSAGAAAPDYSQLPPGSKVLPDGTAIGPNGNPLVWEP